MFYVLTMEWPLVKKQTYKPFTLVGPPVTKPVQDPLAVKHLNNWLIILWFRNLKKLAIKLLQINFCWKIFAQNYQFSFSVCSVPICTVQLTTVPTWAPWQAWQACITATTAMDFNSSNNNNMKAQQLEAINIQQPQQALTTTTPLAQLQMLRLCHPLQALLEVMHPISGSWLLTLSWTMSCVGLCIKCIKLLKPLRHYSGHLNCF